MDPKLTIFFPCYNSASFIRESFALIDKYIQERNFIQIMFIEDCGTDNTYQLLTELVKESPNKHRYSVLQNEINLGKGGTVKRAINLCLTELMIFTDPDLAYDLENVSNFYNNINHREMLIANRVHINSRYLIPPSFFRYIYTRHLSSRIDNKIAQILLIPGIEDNQAGLKMFFVQDIKPLLLKSKQNDFSLDLELLVLARSNGILIKSMPVNYKYESETTTVAFLSDSVKLLKSLVKIFIHHIIGHYKINK